MEIDACPMEGFDKAGYDKDLDLESQNLASAVVVALGYRNPDDPYSKVNKVRKPLKEFLIGI